MSCTRQQAERMLRALRHERKRYSHYAYGFCGSPTDMDAVKRIENQIGVVQRAIAEGRVV